MESQIEKKQNDELGLFDPTPIIYKDTDILMINAEILAHSKTEYGAEAVTMRVTLPRIILAELNTHRKLAKNTSSSRAIPISKMLKHVWNNMFYPVHWGANQAGMQAHKELVGTRKSVAKALWRLAGISAISSVYVLNKVGVHKQITNRLIENFSYITVIFTTTDLNNILSLRDHADAQPEFAELAKCIRKAYDESSPHLLKKGEWHLPLIRNEERIERSDSELRLISAARCASTSYQTVDGKFMTVEKALEIAGKLTDSTPIHASPFEHQLTPDELVEIEWRTAKSKKKMVTSKVWKNSHLHGNTIGFIQNRKLMPNESVATDNAYHLNFGVDIS